MDDMQQDSCANDQNEDDDKENVEGNQFRETQHLLGTLTLEFTSLSGALTRYSLR
ncbi:hypothetical protein RND71_026189 [Anisodus tanguticus]|uniref:Uncharacterized protein n=1 Tax=Anisodus tanguticus TaxID=243964 RepID=A0AAE1VB25_9SOLA|nr:hypothetical protein RND71_026189 [Anisodus tanguticus]